MTSVTLAKLQSEGISKKFPKFKSGQTVRVHEKITEGSKERIQIFEGLIIQTGGQGQGRTITVRRIVGGIGVEKIFSIHSPSLEKIEVTKEAKVRRSKLFFMRERKGKSARLKEKFLTEKDLKELMPHEVTEDEVSEAIEAQKTQDETEKTIESNENALAPEEKKPETDSEIKAE